jgi:hypothetical protein
MGVHWKLAARGARSVQTCLLLLGPLLLTHRVQGGQGGIPDPQVFGEGGCHSGDAHRQEPQRPYQKEHLRRQLCGRRRERHACLVAAEARSRPVQDP